MEERFQRSRDGCPHLGLFRDRPKLFLDSPHLPEQPLRLLTGFVRWHPSCDEPIDTLLEVVPDLEIHSFVRPGVGMGQELARPGFFVAHRASSALGELRDGLDVAAPLRLFACQSRPTLLRQPVVLGPAPLRRDPPLGR